MAARSAIAFAAALIVPPLEETIFRGFILTHLATTCGRRLGWILTGLLFAIAHFLRFPSNPRLPESIHWWSGADAMAEMFGKLGQGEILGGRGLNLFLAGLILGGIFLRTGTLWINEGLHAGWIFVLVTFGSLTARATTEDSPSRRRPLGHTHRHWGFVVVGPLALVLSPTNRGGASPSPQTRMSRLLSRNPKACSLLRPGRFWKGEVPVRKFVSSPFSWSLTKIRG